MLPPTTQWPTEDSRPLHRRKKSILISTADRPTIERYMEIKVAMKVGMRVAEEEESDMAPYTVVYSTVKQDMSRPAIPATIPLAGAFEGKVSRKGTRCRR
jgi:hypothetical protein